MTLLRTLAALALTLLAACGSSSNTTTDGGGMTCSTCFVHGKWQIDNLSPCLLEMPSPSDPSKFVVTGVVSSVLNGAQITCPTDGSNAVPATPFSTDKLTVDCPGHYRLCYTLKAGSAMGPLPADCVIAQSCAEGDYSTAGVAQTWTPLPAWSANAAGITCGQHFYDTGGYGELSVTGNASGCGAVSRVISRVTYCPLACNGDPNAPGCPGCMPGGNGGDF